MLTSPATGTHAVLAALWQRHLPQVLARLDILDRAAAAAATGLLTPELHAEALTAAHTLAGSLGMYGYPQGTAFARQFEQHLEAPQQEPGQLLMLAGNLRQSLFPTSQSAN